MFPSHLSRANARGADGAPRFCDWIGIFDKPLRYLGVECG
jgi:hypothetical protein